MPADFVSVILLILVRSAEAVERLGPYLVAGLAAAWLSSRLALRWLSGLPRLSSPVATPFAALIGVLSPIPTAGAVPFILHLRERGLPGDAALAFVLASSLMNPQLFTLTFGAFGVAFALVQLGTVLSLSIALGKTFGSSAEGRREVIPQEGAESVPLGRLAEHLWFHFLSGVIAGSSLQVLLPLTGAIDWLAESGLLSAPAFGWMLVPFYICGGSSIPLAKSLSELGFGWGALFTFLLVGPFLRATTLANLACLLPRRALATCLAALVLTGGLLGWGFDLALEAMR